MLVFFLLGVIPHKNFFPSTLAWWPCWPCPPPCRLSIPSRLLPWQGPLCPLRQPSIEAEARSVIDGGLIYFLWRCYRHLCVHNMCPHYILWKYIFNRQVLGQSRQRTTLVANPSCGHFCWPSFWQYFANLSLLLIARGQKPIDTLRRNPRCTSISANLDFLIINIIIIIIIIFIVLIIVIILILFFIIFTEWFEQYQQCKKFQQCKWCKQCSESSV